ncbi:MAG: carboxypeptidase regulatory-like domain-containing protein [Edaphobacter sp.]|uniref:TonB-dependent receptor n=1 Tax=Edaphobacter sp. TaxID=1934404 RepID=UPI00238B54D0|nr:carboxypeptidase regulatory-like domain-containing protein [Edaphobacter sp.]MDE1176767.1 carboxypeptidase regulatory-like domain-containing protein [Edaphobacter sp.]
MTMRKAAAGSLFALLFLVLSAIATATATAQTSKGILVGVVRDASGAVVPFAKVTVINENTGEKREETSAADGTYRVDAINPGTYEVDVTANGFKQFQLKGNVVNPSVATTANATLDVGGENTVVEVQADSNGVNTQNAQLSGTISAAELKTLPIFTLNPAELVNSLPGAQNVSSLNLGGAGGNGSVQISINGARPRSNNFMLDGMDTNDVSIGGEAFQPVMPDFFSNATALLNSSSAEFGRSGGAVINQVTNSGTNAFHGSAYEIYTGSALDSLDGQTRRVKPLAADDPNPKARYNQHQIGFTVGGPIIKDKLFAFGGGTWIRYYGNTQADPVELPDAAGYAQLSAIGGPLATQLQGYLNNGSYLNTANYRVISPNASSIAISPRSGCSTGCSVSTAVFQRNATAYLNPETQWMYRIDFIPRANDTFNFRYLHDRSLTAPYFGLNPTSLPGFDAAAGGPSELGGGTWTHIFSPNLVNEFRASETRINFQFYPTAETLANPAAKLPDINFSDANIPVLGISQNMPQGRGEELYQFQDTVGWTRGKHTLRMGADISRLLETDYVAQTYIGTLNYNADTSEGGGLSALDNYLSDRLGAGGTATKTFGPTRVDPHIWKLAGFISDDVKLSADFTLNLGIRYDYLTNPLNALPYPALDVNNPFVPIDTYVPINADKNNIAPRIGFAYVPRHGFFADGRTVIHGGFGIFYDPFFTNILVNSAQSSPVAPTTTLRSTAIGGLTGASGLIATMTPAFSASSSVQSVASNLVNPQTYQYNFGLERELPFQLKATVNYVGARGLKLYSNRQLNYAVNGAFINPNRGAINVRDNRAGSSYNSLQVGVDRQFSKGFFFRSSYTYSKNLDNASEVFNIFNSPTSYQANLAGNGIRQEWGNSAFDRRHVASFVYSYEPRGFHSENAFGDFVLSAFTRHITISGQTQFATGPYTSFNTSGRDINNDGSSANDRPILSNSRAPLNSVGVDGSAIGGTSNVYYDYAAYNASLSLPSAQRVRTPVNAGDVHFLVPSAANGASMVSREIGRNAYANPGMQTWNVAAQKAIPATFKHLESGQFIFRVEAENIANHNNVRYLNPNVTLVGQSSYLNISNARDPSEYRHLRLWAKFNF